MWLWTPMGGMTLKDCGSECLWRKWLWTPKIERDDSEYLNWKKWPWTPKLRRWLWTLVALNSYKGNDSKRLWKWWLWTPMGGMTLKACGFEWLWRKCLWMPMKVVALNAWGRMALKAYENDGFECLRQGRWLRTPEIEEGGFERLTMSNDSKH